MTVETASDRLTMLSDFGESVTFSPGNCWPNRSDQAASITIIFDADYLELTAERQTINSNNPICLARSVDVAGAVRGSVINRTDTAKDYKVVNVEPDGTGITMIELEGPR